MIRRLSFAALATAALSASGAFAQEKTSEKMGVNDALFAAAAADGGMSEVMLAEMGAKKAVNPELKKFSEHMVESHAKVNGQLKELAAKKGLTLPKEVGVGHQFCAQSLAGLSGEAFDHAYAQAQMVNHMAAIAAFKAEAERGQDPEVKAWAAKTLPAIEEHARELRPIFMHHESHHERTHGDKAHGEKNHDKD